MADASLRECVRRMRYDNKGEWISIHEKASGTQALFNLVPPLNSNKTASSRAVLLRLFSFVSMNTAIDDCFVVPAPACVLRISFLSSSNLLLGSVLSSATEVAWDFCKPCSSCSTLFMQPALRPSASYFHIPQFVLRHFTCAHVCSCHPSTLFMLTRS